MKNLILVLVLPVALLVLAPGCVTSKGVTQLLDPDVIDALSRDTNSVELTVTSPAFGTLKYSRNMPRQTP